VRACTEGACWSSSCLLRKTGIRVASWPGGTGGDATSAFFRNIRPQQPHTFLFYETSKMGSAEPR
jgi:hypothetical protein